MNKPIKLLLAAVGIAVGVIAVVALREATLSTHQEIAPDSKIELVVSGRIRGGGEAGQTMDELVEAQVQTCRLEVNSDVVGDVESLGDNEYRAVLQPDMDQTNKRQFRGCLEDWKIDQFQLDVLKLEALATNKA